ncbi:MAG: 4Fe-4S binding protein [Campylobacterota bacterium]|nr:4Fe-4S binding protein [Campylobacterota bacterium]
MSVIALSASSCVRSLNLNSECNRCELICPTDAIVIADNPLPSINFSQCVACGACVGVCPSEALALDDFSSTNFFFEFLAEESSSLLSCKKNLPCLTVLTVEHLISLTILKSGVVFDIGHCEGCEIASTCYPQIVKNQEETNYLLEAMESESRIKLENISYESSTEDGTDRRGFLNAISLDSVGKVKRSFESEVQKASDELTEHTVQKTDIALLRQKRIPEKRKLFFSAIKRLEKPSQFHRVDATEVSFTSQKLMDEKSCTACQMCYRLCPTGALTSDIKNSKIDFDPFLCIKCNICHDSCESDAITVSNSYNLKQFFEPEVQSLIKFKVTRCNECNIIFSTNNSDTLCYRCKAEEEEARSLWGIE